MKYIIILVTSLFLVSNASAEFDLDKLRDEHKYFANVARNVCYEPFWKIKDIWCPEMECVCDTIYSIIIFISTTYSCLIIIKLPFE